MNEKEKKTADIQSLMERIDGLEERARKLTAERDAAQNRIRKIRDAIIFVDGE